MKKVESAAIEDEVEVIERNNFVSFVESFVPRKKISSFLKSLAGCFFSKDKLEDHRKEAVFFLPLQSK